MTCGDKFFSILSMSFLSIIGCIGESLAILSVIMIMICFLGKEGTITKKTFVPIFIFLGIGMSFNTLAVLHDYLILKPNWNEIYEAADLKLSNQSAINVINTILCLLIMIIISITTFKRHRIINSVLAIVCTVIFEIYITCGMLYSAMYFSDESEVSIKECVQIYEYESGFFSYTFTFAYLAIMLIFFLTLYFGMVKKHRSIIVGWRFRILFILWEALMIYVLVLPFGVGLSKKQHVRFMGYELGIIMPIMCIVVPFLLAIVISRRFVLNKILLQEEYISAELDYINQYKQNQNEIRAFRHDIINNLSMLSVLHKEKNHEAVQEYIDTLLGNVKSMSPKFITGDEMLDCIVGMKATKMEEEGIDFSLEGVLDGGLGMKPVDVCSIFANALDNAIEACEKIPKDLDRWIKLSVKRTDKFFLIKLKNTMDMEEKTHILPKLFVDGEQITTKKDKAHHGFGVHNMKATILRYEGIEKVDIEDGVFTLSIVIPRTN